MNFNEKCYKILKRVPFGRVVTYREIASCLGTKAYRRVGKAMKENKNKKVKCYKVVKSNGEIGGFNKGEKEKIKLLKKEGIAIRNGKIDLRKYRWKF